MSNAITPNPQSQALIEKWKQAKDSEKQWTEYRHSLEAAILAAHQDEFDRIAKSLEGKDVLTASTEIGDLVVKLGSRLSLEETQVMLFLSEYPHLTSVLFKTKHEPVNSRSFMKMLNGTDNLSEDLKKTATLVPIKPGFSQK